MITKREKMIELFEKAKKDNSLPLKSGATRLVFGNGTVETKIMLIGEGPGFNEDQQGIPFVGRAGKLLDETLGLIGLTRKQVFTTNVVLHRPPENRDPLPDEISAYAKYLDTMIRIINPSVIVTLGRFSMGKFLPDVFISQVHGQPQEVEWEKYKFTVIPMYHPAAALRNGEILKRFKEDFKQAETLLYPKK